MHKMLVNLIIVAAIQLKAKLSASNTITRRQSQRRLTRFRSYWSRRTIQRGATP
jgi:hypothetical protein